MILTAWMAFTQADADAVRAAIVELAIGKRTVSISFAGPPARSRTFALVELDDLRSMLADIERQLGNGASYRLASTRKGLGS